MDSKETPSSKIPFYKRWVFWVPITLLLLFVIGAASSPSSSQPIVSPAADASAPPQTICDTDQQALKQQAQKVDYKQLSKEPDKYNGTVATFTGKVLQIEQNGDEGVMRLSVTNLGYGVWSSSDVLYVTYHKASDALEDDIVTVTGNLTGSQTYTSQANYQITIPSMDVCSVTKASPAKKMAPAPASSGSSQTAQPAQQTYTTPSGAVVNNSGSVVTAPPKPAASWHTVGTFSGQTQKNTAPFTIQGSQWRITWQETGDGYFGANIESPSGDGYCSIANLAGSGSDSTYCYGAGTYYLSVNTANSWTMTVEDYY
ncbi:MAG: hypothetical protein KGH79_01995 [Patescibacteria group bacterium]|nr:hypothetical protein [Patescibacteria group bacterium]